MGFFLRNSSKQFFKKFVCGNFGKERGKSMQRITLDCAVCDSHKIGFLKHCNQEQLQKVSTGKTCCYFKKGQHIFYEGNLPMGIHCISSGVVKLVRTNLDGKEQILRFAQKGDYLGYRALVANEPLLASAIAIEDTIACFVPKRAFLDLIDEVPAISKELLVSLCHDLGVVEERVQSMAQKSVRERLAETLLFLHETFNSEDENTISITLPREDIANIVGTATETVIRLLSEFKTDKLIEVDGKKIRLLDKQKLDRISHASV
jgi:CRP/FNR family transcriptional regulator